MNINYLFLILSTFSIFEFHVEFVNSIKSSVKSISIRGHPQAQQLIESHTRSWNIFTYENNVLQLENNGIIDLEDSPSSWVYPTSYDTLYLPSDLPKPLIRPSLGIVLIHGTPRYIMPSIVTTLKTPDRNWRNRGICSLPRAFAWIDLFAPFTPKLEDLRISIYGKVASDVRFLEDQDGSTSWNNLLRPLNPITTSVFRPNDIDCDLEIESIYLKFKNELAINLELEPLRREGYQFVDIPLRSEGLPFPGTKIKAFLSDFTEPDRLLEIEDASLLDQEPCGELDINLTPVGAGGTSKFLPEVYRDLYEEGNIIPN